jgi:anti-sigma B factor antagonist
MDDDAFDITVEQDDGDTVLRLRGQLDLLSAPLLRDAVDQLEPQRVVLDVSGVEFMNSSGLSVLIVLAKRLRGQGGELVIRGAQPMLTKTFEISGVTEVLTIEP